MPKATAHQLARRRRRRVAELVARDEVYGVTVRARGRSFELVWRPEADPLVALAQVHGVDEHLEQLVAGLIWRCRIAGLSWDDIAGMLGYSRAAVQKRYGQLVAQLEQADNQG
jgi:CRP-like cAMP-binding protein